MTENDAISCLVRYDLRQIATQPDIYAFHLTRTSGFEVAPPKRVQ